MATRVLLTIDTELTWRHFAQGADWRDNFTLSCEPCGVGLAYQLEMLRRHALDACFFVDPMPALVYGSEPIKRMVEPILEAGQEVQLHLHSFWHDLAQGNGDKAEAAEKAFAQVAAGQTVAHALAPFGCRVDGRVGHSYCSRKRRTM